MSFIPNEISRVTNVNISLTNAEFRIKYDDAKTLKANNFKEAIC